MSNTAIRQTLEADLSKIAPPIDTQWENDEYSPKDGTPYQQSYSMFARPENPTLGDGFYRQRGIFQVTLRYPSNQGSGDASERADLLREHYHRGLSLVGIGVTVIIDETPEIGAGFNVDDRFVIVVRIRFYSDVFRSN